MKLRSRFAHRMSTAVWRMAGIVAVSIGLATSPGCTLLPHDDRPVSSAKPSTDQEAEFTKLDPEQQLNVKLALARTLEQTGDNQRAQNVYERLLERFPDETAVLHRLAISYDRQGRVEQSARLFKRALKKSPDDPDLLCDAGYSAYLQGRLDVAEKHLKRALAVEPQHKRAKNNLGLVFSQQGKREEAFRRFVSSGCSRAEAHMNVAFGLALSQRFGEARAEYQLALAEDAESTVAKKRLREMDEILAELSIPAPSTVIGEAHEIRDGGATAESIEQTGFVDAPKDE